MVIYEVEAPNGRIYEIEGPEGADQSQILQAAKVAYEDDVLAGIGQSDPGFFENAFSGVGQGATNLFESAALGAATLLPEEYETPTRDVIQRAASAIRPEGGDPESITNKLGQGVGSILGFAPTMLLGPGALAGAGALAVGAGAGEASERARAAGTDEATRTQAALQGAPVGALEVLPLMRIARAIKPNLVKDLNKWFGPDEVNSIGSRISSAAKTGGFEAAQEVAANTLQNLIERGYNPERGVVDGNVESAWVGGGSGAIVQALVDLFAGRRAGSGMDTPPPVEEGEPPLQLGNESDALANPVVFPDGSVATLQSEVDAYNERRAERQQVPEPEVVSARQRADEQRIQQEARDRLGEQDMFPMELEQALEAPPAELNDAQLQQQMANAENERALQEREAEADLDAEIQRESQVTIDEAIRRDEDAELETMEAAEDDARVTAEIERLMAEEAEQERQQADATQRAQSEREALEAVSQQETRDNQREGQRRQQSEQGRRRILEGVMASVGASDPQLLTTSFQDALADSGYGNTELLDTEAQTIQRAADVAAAEPVAPEVEPQDPEAAQNAEMEAAIPERRTEREPEQVGIPNVGKRTETAPVPDTGPAQPVDETFFDELGIQKRAPIRRRLAGMNLADPYQYDTVRQELTDHANNRNISSTAKFRITRFLEDREAGDQLEMFTEQGRVQKQEPAPKAESKPDQESPTTAAPDTAPEPTTTQAAEVPLEAGEVFTVGEMSSAGAVPLITDMMRSRDYQRREKGRDIEVEQMSPAEYVDRAAEILAQQGTSTKEEILAQRRANTANVNGIAEAMQQGEKFAAPYLDYTRDGAFGQDGIHRALAAESLGMESIPVAVLSKFTATAEPTTTQPAEGPTDDSTADVESEPSRERPADNAQAGDGRVRDGDTREPAGARRSPVADTGDSVPDADERTADEPASLKESAPETTTEKLQAGHYRYRGHRIHKDGTVWDIKPDGATEPSAFGDTLTEAKQRVDAFVDAGQPVSMNRLPTQPTETTTKTQDDGNLPPDEADQTDLEQYGATLGRPMTNIEPNEKGTPADLQAVETLKQGNAKGPEGAARNYFSSFERVGDALLTMAYDSVMGPPRQYQFKEGEVTDTIRAFFKGKSQNAANSAQKWVKKNLSPEANRYLEQQIENYQRMNQADLETARDKEAKREAARLSKLLNPKDTDKAQLNALIDNLMKRQLKAEARGSKLAADRFARFVERIELIGQMKPGQKFVDSEGNALGKQQMLDRLMAELNELRLTADAINATAETLHPAAQSKLRANDLVGALEVLAAVATTPTVRRIASKLAGKMGTAQVVIEEGVAGREGAAGVYDPVTNTITLDASSLDNTHALLHEATHVATSATLANKSHPMTKQMQTLFDNVKDWLGTDYSALSLDEFAAEAWSNPETRRKLEQITVDGGKITAWAKFRNMIGNMLRSLLGMAHKKPDSALDQTDRIIDAMLAPAPESRLASALKLEFDDMAADMAQTPQTPQSSEKTLDKLGKVIRGKLDNAFTQERVDTAHEFFTGTAVRLGKRGVLGTLPLYPVYKLAEKYFPKSAPKFLELVRQYNGEINAAYKEVGEGVIGQVKDFIQKTTDEKRNALQGLILEGDREQVDLSLPRDKHKGDRLKKYDELKEKYWKTLGADGQQTYKRIRRTYDQLFNDIVKQIRSKVEAVGGSEDLATALHNEFMKQLDRGGIVGYFARHREGDWVLDYLEQNADAQDRVFLMFKSRAARDRAKEEIEASSRLVPGSLKAGKYAPKETFDDAPPTSFIGSVVSLINNNKPDQADEAYDTLTEEIMRLAIHMSPQGSLAKSLGGRSENYIGGYDTDVLKVFTESAMKLKRRETNLRFNAEFRRLLREIKDEGKPYQNSSNESAILYKDEMVDRLRFAINPALPTWSHRARAATYGMTLGLNTSSALIDMAAIPMVIYPVLKGTYNQQGVWSAINEATRLYMGSGRKHKIESYLTAGMSDAEVKEISEKLGLDGRDETTVRAFYSIDNQDFSDPNLPPRQRRLQTLVERARDLGMIQRFSVFDDTDAIGENLSLAKVNAYQGAMMQASERMRREISLVAAYNLELDRMEAAGQTIDDAAMLEAANTAVDFTEYTSGGTSSLATARFAQTGLGAVIMMYKRYGMTMMFMQYNMLKTMLDSEADPAARGEAKRQFAWTWGMSASLAGVTGAPMMGIIAALYDLMKDDEDDDFRTSIQKSIGTLGAYGLLDTVTGMSISQRVALTDMLLHSQLGDADQTPGEFLWATLGGPAAGTIDRMYRGFNQIREGHLQRGTEQMMPSAIANAMKSYRLALEGATTLRGDPITGDLPPQSVIGQFLGFSPAEVARKQRFVSMQKAVDRRISEDRTKLFEKVYLAQKQGDTMALQDAMYDIQEFNARNPDVAIKGSDLSRSRSIRQKIDAKRMYGVVPGNVERWRREAAEVLGTLEE